MGDKFVGNVYESSMLFCIVEWVEEGYVNYVLFCMFECYWCFVVWEVVVLAWEGFFVIDIDNFFDQFVVMACKQVLENGVFVGIVLVYGIEELKCGQCIDFWDVFQEKVIVLFFCFKQEVFWDVLSCYFKYFVNSQCWVQGLGCYFCYFEQ